MSFIWPPMLLTLLLVPIGVGLYLFLGTATSATGRARIRSRIAPVLMLCGLILLPVAMARPQAVVSLPQEEGTVVLAFDVSASMAATDLAPTRMAAAKAAAKDFVGKQPSGVTIGVVAFIALIAMVNWMLGLSASCGGPALSLERMLGWVFSPLAWM